MLGPLREGMAMRIRTLGATVGAALIVASCGAREMSEASRRSATIENDIVLSSALAHAQSELELAQLAEQKAHTGSIVTYARRIAGERAPLVDQLAAAAKADGASADRNHTPNADLFKPLQGEAFERAYVASQIEDQQNAVDFFDFASQTSADASVKQLAAAALPPFRQDLADALGVVKDIPFEQTATDEGQGAGQGQGPGPIMPPRRR
jgi:predicted outer membrane protein